MRPLALTCITVIEYRWFWIHACYTLMLLKLYRNFCKVRVNMISLVRSYLKKRQRKKWKAKNIFKIVLGNSFGAFQTWPLSLPNIWHVRIYKYICEYWLTSQDFSSSLTNNLHDPHPNVHLLVFNIHLRGRVVSMCEKVNGTLTIGEISLPGQVAYIMDKYPGPRPKLTS